MFSERQTWGACRDEVMRESNNRKYVASPRFPYGDAPEMCGNATR